MIEKCPRCQNQVRMIAGLECPKCGHRLGVQNLETDWSLYDPDTHTKRARNADDQSRPYRGNHQRRRNPLDFK